MSRLSPDSSGAGTRTEVDVLFQVLANEDCRRVLRTLQSSEDTPVSVADLVANDQSPAGREGTAVKLRHMVLPQLADAGWIEYDRGDQTVSYREQPVVERVLWLTAGMEPRVDPGE